jgi:uncharacterized DUF497 family protein
VTYDWSEEKNRLLKEKRRVSFEEIVLCIQENKVVTVLEHPNKGRYPNQFLYLFEARQQIYVVPFYGQLGRGGGIPEDDQSQQKIHEAVLGGHR